LLTEEVQWNIANNQWFAMKKKPMEYCK
jgi:hypothetical protein